MLSNFDVNQMYVEENSELRKKNLSLTNKIDQQEAVIFILVSAIACLLVIIFQN